MGPNFASTEQIPPTEQSQPSLEAGSSPQFPFPFPGLPSQGQDNPIMAAAMQQVTFRLSPSFQISGCPPWILSLTTFLPGVVPAGRLPSLLLPDAAGPGPGPARQPRPATEHVPHAAAARRAAAAAAGGEDGKLTNGFPLQPLSKWLECSFWNI